MTKLKLVLMGTGPFAVPTFEKLRSDGHEILSVVTRPAPPVKSRRGPPPAPVRSWAESHGLAIFDPGSINDPDAIAVIARLRPDLLVVCDYGQILQPAALETARLGGINLHGSLLPAYRGAAPVQWAVLNGDETSGVTVIHMTPRLDGGPILCRRETALLDRETAGELEERLSNLGVDAVLEAVAMLQSWDGESPMGQPQPADKVSKAPRLSKSDGQIDWGRSAREIDFHVRGMNPWPIAFTHMKTSPDKPPIRLAIKSIIVSDQASGERSPGEVVRTETEQGVDYWIATGDFFVEIDWVVPAGKRPMSGTEFFRGHQPGEGTRLFA